MSRFFDEFIGVVIKKFSNQVVQLEVSGKKALLFKDCELYGMLSTRLSRYPSELLRVQLIFHPSANTSQKCLWIESSHLLTPDLALQISEAVIPTYSGIGFYVEASRPGKIERGGLPETHKLYYVDGDKVEEGGPLSW